MKIALIVLLVLLVLLLIPFGALVRYDRDGFAAFVKVLFLRVQVYPAPEKKKGKEKKREKEREKKPSDQPTQPAGKKKDEPKKGGTLDLVRAALPLVKPALVGLKKRLTVNQLDLHVTWAGDDPADVAVGYGCANAALGTLWAMIDQNFKVRKSNLGVDVDFDQSSPTVYLDAIITLNLWKALTLALPLLVRFSRNYSRLRPKTEIPVPDDKTKKEA